MENWWYLSAKWETSLDAKSRLLIPRELIKEMFNKKEVAGKRIFFGVDENGVYIIMSIEKKKGMVYSNPITSSKTNYRLLIPTQLRKTNSFFYGRKVILVFNQKKMVEIWPRP